MISFKSIAIVVLVLIFKVNCQIACPSLIIYEAFTTAVNNFRLENGTLDSLTYERNSNDVKCLEQLSVFVDDLAKFDTWALEVYDSWGKLPSGVLAGNLVDFGNFDQCLNVNYKTADFGIFKGQYCLAVLDIGKWIPLQSMQFTNLDTRFMTSTGDIGANLGLCIPQTCSAKFLTNLLTNVLDLNFVEIPEKSCQTKDEKSYSGMDIFAICFFCTVGCFMLASTIYDLVVQNIANRNSIFIAFSVYTNGEKLFKCIKGNNINVLDCVNGIRSLSIIWVVFGHSYLGTVLTPNINTFEMLRYPEKFQSVLLLSASVSVDTFLLLSGLFVAWSVLRHLDESHGKINILLMYFHRYIRLTPAFAAAILFYSTLAQYMASGPMHSTISDERQICSKYWWSALLYVHNYVNPESMCYDLSWYLAVDTQFFVISPLIIYPLWKWRYRFILVIPILAFLSSACTIAIFLLNDYKISLLEPTYEEKNIKTYFPSHSRIGPYLIGILLAFILNNIRGRAISISKGMVFVGWCLSLGLILTVISSVYPFYQTDNNSTILENAFYEGFSRVGWSIGVAWIIFACVQGYGGPINWFLSLPQWQPISRLSYSIYIVHYSIQKMLSASTRTNSYFSDINSIHSFWGLLGLSICMATVWSLAFESPILILEKMLLDKGKTKLNKN